MYATKYGIRLTEDNIDLVTFLNDGVRPEISESHFLIVRVDGPREITSKIMTIEERNAEIRSGELHDLF